jgi:hypothetical protein
MSLCKIAHSADEHFAIGVGETPAQRRPDDQNYGDHTEISGLLSNRRMLQHFSDFEIAWR